MKTIPWLLDAVKTRAPAAEAPQAQPDVLRQRVERRARATGPDPLLVLLDPAELDPRLPARLRGVEPAADEVVRAGVEMELEFLGQFALEPITAEESSQVYADRAEHLKPPLASR